jgi:ethanolamine ammonia-lyase large subunit
VIVADREDDFYPRMIALCVGCAISFIRDYEADQNKRKAIARRVGLAMAEMVNADAMPAPGGKGV